MERSEFEQRIDNAIAVAEKLSEELLEIANLCTDTPENYSLSSQLCNFSVAADRISTGLSDVNL